MEEGVDPSFFGLSHVKKKKNKSPEPYLRFQLILSKGLEISLGQSGREEKFGRVRMTSDTQTTSLRKLNFSIKSFMQKKKKKKERKPFEVVEKAKKISKSPM